MQVKVSIFAMKVGQQGCVITGGSEQELALLSFSKVRGGGKNEMLTSEQVCCKCA